MKLTHLMALCLSTITVAMFGASTSSLLHQSSSGCSSSSSSMSGTPRTQKTWILIAPQFTPQGWHSVPEQRTGIYDHETEVLNGYKALIDQIHANSKSVIGDKLMIILPAAFIYDQQGELMLKRDEEVNPLVAIISASPFAGSGKQPLFNTETGVVEPTMVSEDIRGVNITVEGDICKNHFSKKTHICLYYSTSGVPKVVYQEACEEHEDPQVKEQNQKEYQALKKISHDHDEEDESEE